MKKDIKFAKFYHNYFISHVTLFNLLPEIAGP